MSEELQVLLPIAIVSAGVPRPDLLVQIEDLERNGQAVTLVCLAGEPHERETTSADVLHPGRLSPAVASSFAVRLLRDPSSLLSEARTLSRLPVAAHLARILPGRGVVDVRGADARSARVADAVKHLGAWSHPDAASLGLDWSRLGARRVAIRWLTHRINSITAEASLDDGRRVIVKRQQPHPVLSPQQRAADEHGSLRAVAATMMDEQLRVPRVLLFDPEAAVIVMEPAEGTILETMFGEARRGGASLERLAAGLRGAGRWLAAMQGVTAQAEDGGALLASLVSGAVTDVERVSATDRLVRSHRRRILRAVHTLAARVRDQRAPLAGHHGDYFPGNVFFDGSRVTVIDFEGFRDGFPVEDVAFFLLRCELLLRRFSLPSSLASEFLRGYARPVEPDALRLFTLTKGLRALANGLGLDQPLPQRIWARRTITRAMLRALRDRAARL